MKFCVLGNRAGGAPVLNRHPSATVLITNGSAMLFDCGEGTQARLLEAKISRSTIDRIFISHLHVDHVLGLPGLLATFSSDKRNRPLAIYGPQGMRDLITLSMHLMGVTIMYDLDIHEMPEHFSGRIVQSEHFTMEAQMLEHRMPSFGFRFAETSHINIDIHKAEALGLTEGKMIGEIKRRGSIDLPDGKIISLDEITTLPKVSRVFVYCGDTRFSHQTIRLARNADVLLHEATFASDLQAKADHWGHSTAAGAAAVAKEAEVGQLYLTHISTRYGDFTHLLEEARDVFPETSIAEELKMEVVRR